MPEDLKHIEEIRKDLPAVRRLVYMNTGSLGPLPIHTVNAQAEAQQNELHFGRIGIDAFFKKKSIKNEAKKSIAELINAEPEEIALTHNTTEGVNFIVSGFQWKPGDEIVTTNLEHGAILLPLFLIRSRYGVIIKTAELKDNPVEAIKKQITAKTRLIAISHVSFSSGELLPVAGIAELAHEYGIPLLVDGAQAVGAVPVDIKALGVDYYSLPGQKWLCGPEGTGALYVAKRNIAGLEQTFIGLGSVEEYHHEAGYRLPGNARRFEIASVNIPSVIGLKASIEWLRTEVGLDRAYGRIRELGAGARNRLRDVKGVTVLTPEKHAAGLTSFRVEGVEPVRLVGHLEGKGIVIRKISELDCVRAAISFFNTEEEIDRLVKEVAAIK